MLERTIIANKLLPSYKNKSEYKYDLYVYIFLLNLAVNVPYCNSVLYYGSSASKPLFGGRASRLRIFMSLTISGKDFYVAYKEGTTTFTQCRIYHCE